MSEVTMDERYVTYREHSELKDEVTALKNRLAHVPDKLERIDAKLTEIALGMARASTAPVQAQSIDGLSLAVQRMMDAVTTKPRGNSGFAVGVGALIPVVLFLGWQLVSQ